ncbi:hypothetical protein HZY62_02225 [Maribacter polysiphoniae]|uniref:Uncharacterized protein n=1 Tax=Maribacter polysiphoniae TaxID=429344 RepID=A0A316E604_9FLAO|nr:hypothetical protein [Maribacter polysiphoniae]MBD1259390.1 hypothetical protein [Maribacter polysiphoniae]PWK24952.1 hypothetical protein LX92_01320 [Maribacter polysiphoniae]
MKTLFITLFLIVSNLGGATLQETEKMTATFDGIEDGIYYFTDADGFSNEFQHISEDALNSFDLSDAKYKGQTFIITYISETETDDLDEEISVNTITGLKLKQ